MTKLIQSLIDKLFQRKQLGLYCSRHPIAKRQGTKWKYNDQKFLPLLTTLINNQDCVSEDRLNHASLIDEVRYNNAQLQRYRRNNLFDLEQSLTQTQSKNKWIITEGVFGMDGDIAPLPQLYLLAKSHKSPAIIFTGVKRQIITSVTICFY